jgi:phosphate transport system protein
MQTSARLSFGGRLSNLTWQVIELGSLARQAVALGLRALNEGDMLLAGEVVQGDRVLNELRFSIESQCYALIATEQPVASDLRAIVVAQTVCGELERIGDHGKRIAKTAQRMAGAGRPPFVGSILRMGDMSTAMLDRALGAMINTDVAEARCVCRLDDQVDHLYRETFDGLLAQMISDCRTIGTNTYLIQVAHELERVGDRATNIAERVIYSATGELADLNV